MIKINICKISNHFSPAAFTQTTPTHQSDQSQFTQIMFTHVSDQSELPKQIVGFTKLSYFKNFHWSDWENYPNYAHTQETLIDCRDPYSLKPLNKHSY